MTILGAGYVEQVKSPAEGRLRKSNVDLMYEIGLEVSNRIGRVKFQLQRTGKECEVIWLAMTKGEHEKAENVADGPEYMGEELFW